MRIVPRARNRPPAAVRPKLTSLETAIPSHSKWRTIPMTIAVAAIRNAYPGKWLIGSVGALQIAQKGQEIIIDEELLCDEGKELHFDGEVVCNYSDAVMKLAEDIETFST